MFSTVVAFFVVLLSLRFFGYSDASSFGLVIFVAAFLYLSIYKLRSGARRSLRIHAKESSWLYMFLSDGPGVIGKFFIAFLSLFFSVLFFSLLKGASLQHGEIIVLLIMGIVAFLVYGFLGSVYTVKVINQNLHEDIVNYSNEIARIFVSVVMLNLVIALFFSSHDAHRYFVTDELSLSNVATYSEKDAYDLNEENMHSGLMVNAYVFIDVLKLAITREVVETLSIRGYYPIYILVFLASLITYAPFSLTFVLFMKGLRIFVEYMAPFYWAEKDKDVDPERCIHCGLRIDALDSFGTEEGYERF